MRYNSLLAQTFASDLIRRLPNRPKDVLEANQLECRHGVLAMVRIAGQMSGPYERRRFTPTGGLFLEASASLGLLKHGPYHIVRTRRLRRGWDRKSAARSFADLIERVRQIANEMKSVALAREGLYERIEAFPAPYPDFWPDAEFYNGHPTEYSKMTSEDVAFWHTFCDELNVPRLEKGVPAHVEA